MNTFDNIRTAFNLTANSPKEFFYNLSCNPAYVGKNAKQDQKVASSKDGIELMRQILEVTNEEDLNRYAMVTYIKKANKKISKFEGFGLALDTAQIIFEMLGDCDATQEQIEIIQKWKKRNAPTLRQVLGNSLGGGNFQILQSGGSDHYYISGINSGFWVTAQGGIFNLLDKKPDHNKKAAAVVASIRSTR